MSDRIERVLAEATVAELADLVTGRGLWSTRGLPRLGVHGMRLSDGPSGVRGPRWTGPASACFPCGAALGATWDPGLVERVARALGEESRLKGVHVLLAPTLNLTRYPLAGRSFENFSEDPRLTARLGEAYVRGVQATGVSAVAKHFVCNDQEVDRTKVSVDVDAQALHEVHLLPFEVAVRDAGVHGVMAAYNRLGGTPCTEHPWLLRSVLREAWGFEGFVVSDWFATTSTAAAEAGLDLEMPGPPRHFGPLLAKAVEDGSVSRDALTRMARAVLVAAERSGAIDAPEVPPGEHDDPAHRALAREAAASAFVLLENRDDLLPLDRATPHVAVVGAPAELAWIMGGGSVEVVPHAPVTPLDGLRAALGPSTRVTYARGPFAHRTLPDVDGRSLAGGPVTVEYRAGTDPDAPVALRDELRSFREVWVGRWTDTFDVASFTARVRGELVGHEGGRHALGLTTTSPCRVLLDGEVVLDARGERPPGDAFFGFGSAQMLVEVELVVGRRHELVVELAASGPPTPRGFALGLAPVAPPDALERAVEAARAADVAVIVVGTGPDWDTETRDRPSLALPGAQVELVQRICEVQPRTVVCVNAGAPVELAFSPAPRALLQCWLPGEEWGSALADVLFGLAEPGGRLPVTFPARLEDTPGHATYPGDGGVVRYTEGLLAGHRWYDTRGITPRYPFGHGLGYTRFAHERLDVRGRHVAVDVANVGARRGSTVVQVYLHDPARPEERPEQELCAFTKVTLDPGERTTVRFELGVREIGRFVDGAWGLPPPGRYELRVGASSRTASLRAELVIA